MVIYTIVLNVHGIINSNVWFSVLRTLTAVQIPKSDKLFISAYIRSYHAPAFMGPSRFGDYVLELRRGPSFDPWNFALWVISWCGRVSGECYSCHSHLMSVKSQNWQAVGKFYEMSVFVSVFVANASV